jgi:hypothetical protein
MFGTVVENFPGSAVEKPKMKDGMPIVARTQKGERFRLAGLRRWTISLAMLALQLFAATM